MSDDIYLGNGKEKVFQNGGRVINANVCLSDIAPGICADNASDNIKPFLFTASNGNVWLKIVVGERRAPNEKGHTHWVKVDTWVPDSKNSGGPAQGDVKKPF